MILSFADSGTEDIFDGKRSKWANKVCPIELWNTAKRKLDWLDQAGGLVDLHVPPGNRLEKLTGDRRDQHSIRINNQYRICFVWTPNGPANVEIVDYH
jgi:toxin HigB-1